MKKFSMPKDFNLEHLEHSPILTMEEVEFILTDMVNEEHTIIFGKLIFDLTK